MMPISIAIARRIWRGVKPVAAARAEDTLSPRFDRLEQAVDAIAIEVERVSEGQRFVTKVLTERPGTVRQQSAPESNEAAGLGEAVLRMEAERPVAVIKRLLEEKLTGEFTFATAEGPRTIALRGKADRLDLLEDGTFRLIDYKLGWPPDRVRALQLPIYALCAEQQLNVLGRTWTLGEAMYLAFKGPKRVVSLFGNDAARAETLASAQQRLADTLDAIERGEFPPSPQDVFRCETCSYASVCRKDYVGDL